MEELIIYILMIFLFNRGKAEGLLVILALLPSTIIMLRNLKLSTIYLDNKYSLIGKGEDYGF
jgi:hypothetical protein